MPGTRPFSFRITGYGRHALTLQAARPLSVSVYAEGKKGSEERHIDDATNRQPKSGRAVSARARLFRCGHSGRRLPPSCLRDAP